MFARFAGQPKQTVTIPLACFTARGANLSSVDTAFSVESDGQFAAVFGDIEVVGGAAKDAGLACADLK
jgi:beta-glucosidase